MAEINNTNSNTLLSGTSGDDTIKNGGWWYENGVWTDHYGGSNVTINSGAGDDSAENYGSEVTINSGAGNDEVVNWNSLVTINTGEGNDSVYNSGDSVIINTGEGNDSVDNVSDKVTINTGAGNDSVDNSNDSVTINTGEGNDYVPNSGSSVTITGGKGNDDIYNNCYRQSYGSIYYYPDYWNWGSNVLFKYSSGDGNDIIYGFKADSTLSIGGGSYSTKKSGDNVIVTVGEGKISLIGAASLSKVNIKGTKATSTTTLTVNDKTKSPVTVGSAIKTIDAAKRTKAVKITGNKLANTGNDIIYGKEGNDSILGNAGADKLYGGAGNDIIYGGKGNDTLWGNDGADKISGGAGNDTLTGGKGNDSLWGNAGKDTFIYESGDGKDIIYGFENDDMLKITGKYSSSYSKSKGEIAFKVGNTSNAITLSDFSATSFNVNGTNYKISGSKLVKK